MNTSDAVQALIKESYKQSRHEDDRNQPKSVQPWGKDGYKRNYWLIEGQDDTHFRLYRENNGATAKTNTWFSVAGDIDEIKAVAEKLEQEGTKHSKVLRDRINAAVPRFEAGEEKRRKREYRQARRQAFTRPEPGFSLYEGRTRGKRIRYDYTDGDDDSDAPSTRRSTRNSGISTPAESLPVVTSSGRHVKSRLGGLYGETLYPDQRKAVESELAAQMKDLGTSDSEITSRQGRVGRTARSTRKQILDSDDGGSNDSDPTDEANGWSGDEDAADEPGDEFEGDDEEDDDDDMSADGSIADDLDGLRTSHPSLVVQLRYKKESGDLSHGLLARSMNPTSRETLPPGPGNVTLMNDNSDEVNTSINGIGCASPSQASSLHNASVGISRLSDSSPYFKPSSLHT